MRRPAAGHRPGMSTPENEPVRNEQAPSADDAARPPAGPEDELDAPKPAGSEAWQSVAPPGKPDGEVDTRS